VTACVKPPTLIAPLRESVDVLAATVYAMDPSPLPLLPLVIVTQAALEVAAHVQFAGIATDTLPVPPSAAKLALPGARLIVHTGAGWIGESSPPHAIKPTRRMAGTKKDEMNLSCISIPRLRL
jgi:hypothetical protein